MNPNDVIEAYVLEVIRRVPRKQRGEIGFELRGLLAEMLADRAQAQGHPADDATVLAMLREFGAPGDVAARYQPAGVVIIPATQTRSFALTALIGVALQWALTLPAVFQGQHLSTWWLTWGLGSLWWPGFMVMGSLAVAGLKQAGWFKSQWKPHIVDPERVHRGALGIGLVWFAIGASLMIALPWITPQLPGVLPRVLEIDPVFLRTRAPWILPLWLVSFVSLWVVWRAGRWTPLMRKLEAVTSVACILLMVWWVLAGDLMVAKASNDGARACLWLVIVMLLADQAYRLYRRRVSIQAPSASVR